MSGIISGLEKFFTKDRIMIFVVFGILVVFLMWYSGNKSTFLDNMETPYEPISRRSTSNGSSTISPSLTNYESPAQTTYNYPSQDYSIPQVTEEHQYPSSNVATSRSSGVVQPGAENGYSSQHINNSSDLLPTDKNNKWASLNPITNEHGGANVPDLLQAGYHIGLDTIGQTMKNANLQLRSDPYIPKTVVGPWNQSTFEPDIMRVPLEVGV
jgi:hypothetical protein